MAVVETERLGQILVVRMNRPPATENARPLEMRSRLAETWSEFRELSAELEGRDPYRRRAPGSAPART